MMAILRCFVAAWLIFGGQSLSEAIAGGKEHTPVDLAVLPDGQLLVTANQSAGSISLIEIESGTVLDEAGCGQSPAAIATARGDRVLVSTTHGGELVVFRIENRKLVESGRLFLNFAPRGVAASSDGQLAYVALCDAGSVAVVDLDKMTVSGQIEVGRWPRYLALSPDGTRLAVGVNGEMGVAVVDPLERTLLYRETYAGLNLGQVQISRDGRYAYLPWIAYGSNPITAQNIRRGWVIASRMGRVRLDGRARREAIALDTRGEAVGDPHGLALSPDEEWVVVTAGGSHELLAFRLAGLPFQDYGGPGDTINPQLAADRQRFFRVPLGGRPLGVRFGTDNRRVFVANALDDSVQVVDLQKRAIERTIKLNEPVAPSLARRGEAIFYDARRSLDQWYSCHSCHFEGGTNAVKMDTTNDGGFGTFKTVLSLYHLRQTPPWTWHGWQTDLDAALTKSMTETMLGPEPTKDDVAALAAYLDTLTPPPNASRGRGGERSPAAQRGQLLFSGARAGCANCHSGEWFTDGQIHDVGLGAKNDRYAGFNTPSLLGVGRRVRLLHDGRASTLAEVLSGAHAPPKTGGDQLSAEELADLIEYLKTL